jgi:hypothetical protein
VEGVGEAGRGALAESRSPGCALEGAPGLPAAIELHDPTPAATKLARARALVYQLNICNLDGCFVTNIFRRCGVAHISRVLVLHMLPTFNVGGSYG